VIDATIPVAPTTTMMCEGRSEPGSHACTNLLAANGDPASMAPNSPSATDDNAKESRLRLVGESDREPICSMLRRSHEKTAFAQFPFSDAKFDTLFTDAIQQVAHRLALACCRRGAIVGVAWASCGRSLISDEGLMTTIHGIVLDHDRLSGFGRIKSLKQLLHGVQTWSQSRGADCVVLNDTTGMSGAATDRLMRSAGGKNLGGGYVVFDKIR